MLALKLPKTFTFMPTMRKRFGFDIALLLVWLLASVLSRKLAFDSRGATMDLS